MSWKLSRFRAGDIVQIRSKREILATLDERGCVDGLPFMPEMLKFCGQRIRVRAVAHKTCEVALQTGTGRRLASSVHLDNLRCDGSAHGNCQAECTLFWKDVWLRPSSDTEASSQYEAAPQALESGCTEEHLSAQTCEKVQEKPGEIRYSCQATMLYNATEPLNWWDIRQYFFDVATGNHSAWRVVRVLALAWLRRLLNAVEGVPYVRGVVRRINEWAHQKLSGRAMPYLFRHVDPNEQTPTGRLDLTPGEWVRVKPQLEIERTLNRLAKNRGLFFDPEEMAPYCGGIYRVHSSVTRIVDEATGKMRIMKEPCIILDGVVCNAEYARCRLNCPRAIYSYWRELWLERTT